MKLVNGSLKRIQDNLKKHSCTIKSLTIQALALNDFLKNINYPL